MKARSKKTKSIVLLGLLTALLIIMSVTPLGYLNIGMLAITLNIIPVAIAGVALGPLGGAVVGGVFGITSFLQAMGIGGSSALGLICFEISPFLTFIHRVLSRVLTGYLTGVIFRFASRFAKVPVASAIAGFSAAFLNTFFFTGSLILLFGGTEYMQGLIGGQNILLFAVGFVGINAVFEMAVSTFATGAVSSALHRAKLIHIPQNKQQKGE
ncbi:MAG: ECF transporter S component [Clostridia bacterium]|nr:ECF transporter S component [Clostridia bacterium]